MYSLHKKEWNCAICRDMDGPRNCHTKEKNSEEKQISYINTYIYMESRKMVEMNLFAKQK